MKKYIVVEITDNHAYHKQMTSDDGENLYVWGQYVGRKGIQNILNHYAGQGWELFQLVPIGDSPYPDYRAIFVRNV